MRDAPRLPARSASCPNNPPQAKAACPPAPGDLVEIVQGCDKMLATCGGRFGNVLNFRGEPHLPGIDLLTRYPGA